MMMFEFEFEFEMAGHPYNRAGATAQPVT